MSQLIFCIRKDIKEYIRKKRNIIYLIVLLGLSVFFVITTKYFSLLVDKLVEQAPDIISDPTSLNEMLARLFPKNLAENMGVLSADIATFFSITVILIVQGLMPEEIKNGKWIIPLGAGYKKENLIISKTLVNGAGAALPVFIIYNAYYLMGTGVLNNNYLYRDAFINSIVFAFIVFSIAIITILLSIICKRSLIGALSLIMIIMVTPDIFAMFSFGKYLPTYLLTHIIYSYIQYVDILIPLLECLIIMIILYIIAFKKIRKIEVTR